MNKKFLIAWVVLFVVWMIGGFVVHGALLKADYVGLPALFRTDEQSMPYFHWMLIAHAIMAGAFVWIYTRGMDAGPWVGQGLRFGAAIALFAVVPVYMIYFVVQPMPGMLAVKQTIFDSALVLLLGMLVAFLYRGSQRS